MRKVIAVEFVSLDGRTTSPNGEYDFGLSDPVMDRDNHEYFKSIDAILLGRKTYQDFVAFWPTASPDVAIVAEQMNTIPKIVFSKTLERVSWGKWNNARLVKDGADELRQLKQQPGQDMVIFGSAKLVWLSAQEGLIDEYRLFVHPLILGGGLPMFQDGAKPANMKLLDTKTYATGVVLLHYQTT